MTGYIVPTVEIIYLVSKKNLPMMKMNNSFYMDNNHTYFSSEFLPNYTYFSREFPPVERITSTGVKHSVQVIAKTDKETFPAIYDFTNKVWINCNSGDKFIGKVSWAYTLN